MGDGVPPDPSGRGPPVPGGGRSSHAPQDAGTGASSPFAWQGGPLTGSLGALLAAAGAPPGMGAGAWPGFPSTGAPPGMGAGTWPFFPGAGVPPGLGITARPPAPRVAAHPWQAWSPVLGYQAPPWPEEAPALLSMEESQTGSAEQRPRCLDRNGSVSILGLLAASLELLHQPVEPPR
jgi:hypothetical protein